MTEINAMIIGLTGSIGSGKSTAAKRLAQLGALVLDADAICRTLVEPGSRGLAEIINEFGRGVTDENGALDRAALAAVVFNDAHKRLALNAILHPMVLETLRLRAAQSAALEPLRSVVWEVPLLIECGWHEYCDEVWLVTAPREVRAARITARDGCTADDAYRRMDAQLSDAEKAKYATLILDNASDEAALFRLVDEAYARIWGDRA